MCEKIAEIGISEYTGPIFVTFTGIIHMISLTFVLGSLKVNQLINQLISGEIMNKYLPAADSRISKIPYPYPFIC